MAGKSACCPSREAAPILSAPVKVILHAHFDGGADASLLGRVPKQLACQLLEVRPLAELRRDYQLPHSFITGPLPSFENRRHVDCVTLITERTQPHLVRSRRAVARNVPAMGSPLPFDGISRVGNANCAPLMKRLPTLRRTPDPDSRFLGSTHPRLT